MTQVLNAFYDVAPEGRYTWAKGELDPELVRRQSTNVPYSTKDDEYGGPPVRNKLIAGLARRSLRAQWEVSSAEELRDTVNKLLAGDMHTPGFDLILGLTECAREASRLNWAGQMTDEQLSQWLAYEEEMVQNAALENPTALFTGDMPTFFAKWLERYNDERFLAMAPMIPRTTRAWDIARGVNISSLAVLGEMIKPEDLADIQRRALVETRKYFTSWADYAASFWYGRAIWASDEDTMEEYLSDMGTFASDLETALLAQNSPWVRFPLHAA